MTKNQKAERELEDKALKVNNAREVAEGPDASERDKADLKLMEQEFMAERQKVKRQERATARQEGDKEGSKAVKPSDSVDRKLDAALKDSFPGSDPVSFLEASPEREGDRDLRSVKPATGKDGQGAKRD
jgi:hypothetical protein